MNLDNPSNKKDSYFENNVKCFAIDGMTVKGAELECIEVRGIISDTITIIGAFPNGLPAKKSFSFKLDKLKNPYSMTPQNVRIRTFVGVRAGAGVQSNVDGYFTGFID